MQRERERQADAEDAARLLSEYQVSVCFRMVRISVLMILVHTQAATEAERENDAARRGKNISLKKYHVKQVRI